MQNLAFMGKENDNNSVIALDAQKVCVPEYHGLFKKKNSVFEYIPYPIEYHVYMLKQEFRESVVEEILKTKRFGKKMPKFLSTFLKNTYGKTLYELFFRPYYQKIFHEDLTKIIFLDVEKYFRKTTAKEILLKNFNSAGEHSCSIQEFLPPCNVTEVCVKTDRNAYSSILIPNENCKAFRITAINEKSDYNAVVEFAFEVSKDEIEEELLKLPLNPKYVSHSYKAIQEDENQEKIINEIQ